VTAGRDGISGRTRPEKGRLSSFLSNRGKEKTRRDGKSALLTTARGTKKNAQDKLTKEYQQKLKKKKSSKTD